MLKVLTAAAALPIALNFLGSFHNGDSLDAIARNISSVVNVNSGHAFDLGGQCNVSQALNSSTFRYEGGTKC